MLAWAKTRIILTRLCGSHYKFLDPNLLPGRLPAQAGLMVGQMWYVYLLKSKSERWYYVGSTNRLQDRFTEHNKGFVKSTKHYRPFDLVFTKKFELEKDARNYERKIKGRRIEKEAIIRKIENQ